MNEDFVETISKGIESMEIRGAGKIARKASQALLGMAKGYEGNDFIKDVHTAAERLLSTRPTAVSLHNGVSLTIHGLEELTDQQEAIALIIKNAEAFIKRSEEAVDKIVEITANRIPKGARVLTHCNSSAAVKSIIRAHEMGKIEMAYNTESRPRRQGWITAPQLAQAGVPVTMIVDSAARFLMHNIDMVVVGADTIASNGAVINKVGTSQVALAAHEARVPVTVCAESYKFSPMTVFGERVKIEERDITEIANPEDFPGVKFYNPVFDFTPPEYVDAIVTEFGVMSPYAAYDLIIREFSGEALFHQNKEK